MNFIDTHTHLFLPEFQSDLQETLQRAISGGIKKMLLPNINWESVLPMLTLCDSYPGICFPMVGLHPTSIGPDYRFQLERLYTLLHSVTRFVAVGEIGIDLYWDSTYLREQQDALEMQIDWAIEFSLPLVIHSRQSFQEIFNIIKPKRIHYQFTGVFHSFSGTLEQAHTVIELGFMIGINGIVTFKNSGLIEVIREIPLDNLLLETDSPYLAPVPYRGKRNESSYIPLIAKKIAEIKGIGLEEVANTTTTNASLLFNLT